MSRSSTNWISKRRRHAIYRRDNCRCLWCERKPPVKALSLDHFVPLRYGGNDATANLFVSCVSCNSRRGSESVWEFACALSEPLLGYNPERIVARIVQTLSRPLR